jgi:RHS repeat-associated protein
MKKIIAVLAAVSAIIFLYLISNLTVAEPALPTNNPPQPLTQVTYIYQASGAVASRTLSWADGQTGHQLDKVVKTYRSERYSQADAGSDCHTRLPSALAKQLPATAYLLCRTTTQVGDRQSPVKVTYIDIQNDEPVAISNPQQTTRINRYDGLGRLTATDLYDKNAQLLTEKKLNYLWATDAGNRSGYNQVTVSRLIGLKSGKPTFFSQRTLADGLGRLVKKQINTCPDGPSGEAIAGCNATNYGAIAIDPGYQGGFRTLVSDSYRNSQGPQLQLQSKTDAQGVQVHYEYDALGRQIAQTGYQQLSSSPTLTTVSQGVFYDAVDHLKVSYPRLATAVTDGDAHVLQVTYFNNNNKVAKVISIPLLQIQQQIKALGGVPSAQWFSAAHQVAIEQLLAGPVADQLGWAQTTQYDGLARKQQQADAFGSSDYSYTERGLLAVADSSANPLNAANDFEDSGLHYQQQVSRYNLLGQPINLQQSYFHQVNGQKQVVPGSMRQGAVRRYNAFGELTSQTVFTDQAQQISLLSNHFSYSLSGRLIQQTDDYPGPSTIISCRSYNALDQLTGSWNRELNGSLPCGGDKGNARDEKEGYYSGLHADLDQGQLAHRLDFIAFVRPEPKQGDANVLISNRYFPDGKLRQQTRTHIGPGGEQGVVSYRYQYNGLGQTTHFSLDSPSFSSQRSYQYGSGLLHWLVKQSDGQATVSYRYNDQGQTLSVVRSTPTMQVTTSTDYSYFSCDNTAQACLQVVHSTEQGHVLQQQYIRIYQQGQLLKTITEHNKTEITPTDPLYNKFNQTRIYYYDGLNRLIAYQTSPLSATDEITTVRYQLDANNNIEQIKTTSPAGTATTETRSYNAADQLTSLVDTGHSKWQLHYVEGNLTNPPRADAGTYSYNGRGQLISVKAKGGQLKATYRYDPQGELVEEADPQDGSYLQLAYDPQGQLSWVKDNSGATASYMAGIKIIHQADGTEHYQIVAYQGKTPSGWLSDKSYWQQPGVYGAIEARYPGPQQPTATLAVTNPILGFNGSYHDVITGDNLMGSANGRFYDPQLQSFIQLDSDYSQPNRYGYGNANPMDYWDPSGHTAWWKIALGVVVGIALIALTTISGAEGADGLIIEEEMSLLGEVETEGDIAEEGVALDKTEASEDQSQLDDTNQDRKLTTQSEKRVRFDETTKFRSRVEALRNSPKSTPDPTDESGGYTEDFLRDHPVQIRNREESVDGLRNLQGLTAEPTDGSGGYTEDFLKNHPVQSYSSSKQEEFERLLEEEEEKQYWKSRFTP